MALLFKNVLITLSSRVSIVISAILISVLTARFLGPDGRGQYFYIYSLVTLLAQFSMLGLQTSNTYFVASEPSLLGRLAINSAWISAFISTALSLLVVGCIFYFTSHDQSYLWFTIILTPLYLFYLLGVSLMAGANKIALLNYSQLLTNILTIIAVAIAGYYTKSLWVTFAFITLAWLVVAILVFFSLFDKKKSSIKFNFAIFSLGFSYSCKAYVITTCTLIVLRCNVFLLNILCAPKDLGYFSIAAQINDALALLPTTIALLLFPQLVKSKSIDFDTTVDVLKKAGAIMLSLTIFLWIAAPYLIKLFYGAEFLPAVEFLRILLPGGFFSCLILILTQYIAARGLPKVFLIIWISGVLINLCVSYYLIDLQGAIGAALGMTISYSVILVATSVLAYSLKSKPLSLDIEKKMNKYFENIGRAKGV